MKPSAPESKHQRFVRLAEARTNKILATLRSPEKLKYIDGCIHPGGF